MTGRCVAQDACRDYDPHTGTPGWADGALCDTCLHAGKRDIRALVWDYVDLEQAIPGSRQAGPHVTGSRERTTPLALDIDAQQRAIVLITTTWEEILREAAGLCAPATRVRDGWAVQRAVETIEPRVWMLADLPPVEIMPLGPDGPPAVQSGADAVLAMSRVHRWATATLGLGRLVHELPGDCSACGMALLRRDNGSETVHCAGCHSRRTWDDYERYARCTVAWLTPTEAAEVAATTTAELRQWRARGRLTGVKTPQGWRYRAGDVLKLAQDARRRGGVVDSQPQAL